MATPREGPSPACHSGAVPPAISGVAVYCRPVPPPVTQWVRPAILSAVLIVALLIAAVGVSSRGPHQHLSAPAIHPTLVRVPQQSQFRIDPSRLPSAAPRRPAGPPPGPVGPGPAPPRFARRLAWSPPPPALLAALGAAVLMWVRGSAPRRWLVLRPRVSSPPSLAMFASSSKKDAAVATTEPEATPKGLSEYAVRKLLTVVGLALATAAGIFAFRGMDAGSEFLAAYLIEYSLSIDNLFVFLVIFKYFKCPQEYQERVLNYGLISAAVLRFVFLFLGEELLTRFAPTILVFGGVLLFSSYNILFGKDEEEDEDEDLSDNQIVKFAQSFLKVGPEYDRDRFFTSVDGKQVATPLLLVLAVIELSDIVFATDSVPAVLGTTQDLTLAYSSNLFAILGLRSLYFLIAESLDKFKYIEPAIGSVLGFIGAKILVEFAGVDVSTPLSLGVVAGLLGGGVLLSLYDPWADREGR
eukprot:EG_transcript_8766